MMPLAMILAGRGATVAGSDRSLDQGRVPAKFHDLRTKGIALFPQDGSGIDSPDQVVIASAAVEETVADIVAANRLGCARATRAEMLSTIFNDSHLPIGVAGTSGKSTVTGMIGWILHACGRDPTVMNGAVMKNFVGQTRPSPARSSARVRPSSVKSTKATGRSPVTSPASRFSTMSASTINRSRSCARCLLISSRRRRPRSSISTTKRPLCWPPRCHPNASTALH